MIQVDTLEDVPPKLNLSKNMMVIVDQPYAKGDPPKIPSFRVPTIVLSFQPPYATSLPWMKEPVKESALSHMLRRYLVPEEAPVSKEPTTQPTENYTNHELNILVAEDNSMNQAVILKILHSLGYNNVEIVNNGEEALCFVRKKSYNIILMDVMMPISIIIYHINST